MLWFLVLGSLAAQPSDKPYEEALRKSRQALRRRAFKDAAHLCRSAWRASGEATGGGPKAGRALHLCGKIERSRRRRAAAVTAFRKALFATPASQRLRARIRRDWYSALRKAGQSPESSRAIARADRVIDRLRSSPERPPTRLEIDLRRLDEAIRTLQKFGDRRRAAYARALRYRLLARSGRPEAAVKGLPDLTAAKNSAIRNLALLAMAEAWLAIDEPGRAVRAAAKIDSVPSHPLRPGPALRTACRALEQKEGPGSCARQVRRVTGRFMATNHGEGPSVARRDPAVLEGIHQEATLFLQDCLLTHARANPERLRGAQLELSWTIDVNGRSISPDLRPRRYGDLLNGCLRDRLGWLRYPPLRGGRHENVSLAFVLH